MHFWLMIVVFLFLGSILFFCITLICLPIFTAPWVPSSKKDILRILEAAEIKEGDIVYDLGSGDGRIILTVAKIYPIKYAIGIEISPIFYLISILRIWLSGLSSRTKVKLANFYKVDLSKADIVICYLFPKEMKKLAAKFKTELKPGAKIISLIFPIIGWQPINVIRPESGVKSIFVYKII